MGSLELRVPPDVVALVVAVLMWLVSRLGGLLPVSNVPRYLLGMALVLCGVILVFSARKAFALHQTTWGPTDPSRASALVTSGVYRLSRNPMYLGTWLLLLGVGVLFGSVYSALMSLAYVAWVDRFQIVPEERALLAHFGDIFESYRRSVRRWV